MSKNEISTFEGVFDNEIVDMIVESIKVAVDNACDRFDPGVGCNATTFGVDIYNFGVHELKKLSVRNPQIFKSQAYSNSFRLFVKDFELAFHKVGYDVSEGIETSFPNNEGVVSRIVLQDEQQLTFVGDGFEIQPSKKYVLGHFSDPEAGLSGVYLCKPVKNNNAIAWDVTHELWVSGVHSKLPKKVKTKLPPVEKIGDIDLQPKEILGEHQFFPRLEKVETKKDNE